MWPAYDPEKLTEDMFELVVQVNGKFKAHITAPLGITETDAKTVALQERAVSGALAGKEPQKSHLCGKQINQFCTIKIWTKDTPAPFFSGCW